MADMLRRLGDISPDRILWHPLPGTATESDVTRLDAHDNRLCELVDGILVEKPMGLRESVVAIAIARFLGEFVSRHRLGIVAGEAGAVRLLPGLVRIPDVAFISRQRLPNGLPDEPIPQLVPDLAVEVLSKSNTPAEMSRKLEEYFKAGARLVWLVDPDKRSVTVYRAVDDFKIVDRNGTLDGAEVVAGFTLPVAQVFAELDQY
jgi:Uma2 family endonuclease